MLDSQGVEEGLELIDFARSPATGSLRTKGYSTTDSQNLLSRISFEFSNIQGNESNLRFLGILGDSPRLPSE